MLRINKHLIPIKVLLFFMYGGFGCLWPFLSIHMTQLGLTIGEIALINCVTSFTSLLGPPLACFLTNKTKKYKLVLIISLLVCATGFTVLLFVPVRGPPPRSPNVGFECDKDGGRVHVERCDNNCYIPERSPEPSSIHLRHCQYICDSQLGAKGPGSSAPVKPYVCVDQTNGTHCFVYNASGMARDIHLSVPYMEYVEYEDQCTYPLIRALPNGTQKPVVQCRISDPGCAVHCLGVLDANDPESLSVYQCQTAGGHPLLTFGSYLLLRIVAEFFMYAALALIEATIMNNIWEFGGSYSQQFLWGLLPIGILCPVVALVIDHFHGTIPYMNFIPAFAVFDALIAITILLVCFLPLNVHNCINKAGSYFCHIVRNAEVVTFFVMMFFLGSIFGFLETFYYWFVYDQSKTTFAIGLTLTVGIFPSLLLLFFGDQIIAKCTHPNILIAAFAAYAFRLIGCSLLQDVVDFSVHYIVPFEIFKVVANYFMWAAAMTYCEKLGPKVLASTITGTAVLMHTNIGRGVGVIVGGYIMNYFGGVIAFRVTAVFSGCVGLVYMAVYHFYLKTRRSPIYIESSLNGHYTPMETYSNGENQVHKPMLQDKNRY